MSHKLAGLYFKAATQEEHNALQTALFAEGCQWGGSGGTSLKPDYFSQDLNEYFPGYSVLNVKRDGRIWRGDAPEEGHIQYASTVTVKATIGDHRPRIMIHSKTYVLDDVLAAMSVFGVKEAPVL